MRPGDDSDDTVAVLAAHPWVSAVRASGSAAGTDLVIVPSEAGLRAYRTVGHAGLSAAWESHLGRSLPGTWTLSESMPRGDAGRQGAAMPLPQQPVAGMPEVCGCAGGTDGRVQYDLRVPLELPVLRSHFPVAPIVPGVELVRWAVVLGRRHFPIPERFAGVDMLRFRRVVQPGEHLRLELGFVVDTGMLHFTFRSAAEDSARVMANGRIQFRDAGEI